MPLGGIAPPVSDIAENSGPGRTRISSGLLIKADAMSFSGGRSRSPRRPSQQGPRGPTKNLETH